MKVWITKYALTGGIIEAEVEPYGFEKPYGFEWVSASWDNGCWRSIFGQGEWFDTKERAIQKAEEMRQEKIASLKKQIEKLEGMRFE